MSLITCNQGGGLFSGWGLHWATCNHFLRVTLFIWCWDCQLWLFIYLIDSEPVAVDWNIAQDHHRWQDSCQEDPKSPWHKNKVFILQHIYGLIGSVWRTKLILITFQDDRWKSLCISLCRTYCRTLCRLWKVKNKIFYLSLKWTKLVSFNNGLSRNFFFIIAHDEMQISQEILNQNWNYFMMMIKSLGPIVSWKNYDWRSHATQSLSFFIGRFLNA